MLDRALAMLESAADTVPMDRIKVLNFRAVPVAMLGEWEKAQERRQHAISLAEQLTLDPALHAELLANYAHALRKNHHRREARSIEGTCRRDSTPSGAQRSR
jgi:hypothetical protein